MQDRPGNGNSGPIAGDGVSGFIDAAGYPFVRILERNAPAIRKELEQLLVSDPFVPWPERQLYNAGWEVFGFILFRKRITENCARCPHTVSVLEQVPDVTTAGFSRLANRTRIRPHTGFTDKVLRCHLGLIVPPACGIRVGTETRRWKESRCLIFDDTLEHEAWNDSESDRIVLLIDFLKRAPVAGEGQDRDHVR